MRFLLIAAALLPFAALAEDASKSDQELKDESAAPAPFAKGRFVLRGGANLDVNQSINLGGTNTAANPTFGVHGGVGYFPIHNLEVDLDVSFYMGLNPVAVRSLEVTPGARYWLLNMIQLRVGVPIHLYPPTMGVGILGGLAYHQPIGSRAAFVVGADYTYWFTEAQRAAAPLGRVDLHAGVQTWF